MKLITHVKFILYDNTEKFCEDMRSTIDKFQNDGCEVELQYKPTETFFSVLIIGRKI